MTTPVPAALRRNVLARAGRRCEYCRLPESDSEGALHVDHVISEQHGGATISENLAACCPRCNWAKGPNVAAIDERGEAVLLFNPRTHEWSEHFQPDGLFLRGLTSIGRATVRILDMNSTPRLHERELAALTGAETEADA